MCEQSPIDYLLALKHLKLSEKILAVAVKFTIVTSVYGVTHSTIFNLKVAILTVTS